MKKSASIWMLPVSLGFFTVAAAFSGSPGAGERTPVLLELFTSEGCSSCPPADRLLETLDREQPVAGAELIVLSEHVDYWNHLGWSDPYSSPLFSARQEEYVRRLSSGDVYTPQLVVDGRAEVLGSDRAAVLGSVARSLMRPKTALAVSATRFAGGVMLHIHTSGQLRLRGKAALSVILARDSARSSVTRGENKGRALSHVAVAYSVEKAGEFSDADLISRDVEVKPAGTTRVIALLQDEKSGGVLGAAQIRLQPGAEGNDLNAARR